MNIYTISFINIVEYLVINYNINGSFISKFEKKERIQKLNHSSEFNPSVCEELLSEFSSIGYYVSISSSQFPNELLPPTYANSISSSGPLSN